MCSTAQYFFSVDHRPDSSLICLL
ncbi:hypothetical protein NC652_040372 [Populus alba x Populus x berolinensis]|nr:hypothetical protein NC652_040372 [Populus alba x Populus x berolinensis]